MNTRKLLFCFCIGCVSYTCYYYNGFKNFDKLEKTFQLATIENIAYGEYVVGPTGTNWKEYTIECTYTKNNGTGVIHLGPIGSVGYESATSSTYTTVKKACGYGIGTCLSSAGC